MIHEKKKVVALLALGGLVSAVALARLAPVARTDIVRASVEEAPFGVALQANYQRFAPTAPRLAYSPYRTGAVEVAKVFGRSPACSTMDADFIDEVNRAAVRAGVEPRTVAATIAVESRCDPYAVSGRGAIGLMQVMPGTWKGQYDFASVNLLNTRDNLRVGVEILAGLVHAHGTPEGVRRYQGLGVGCSTCDPNYVAKVVSLAGVGR